MGTTIRDVAERAGVSITTVSHVINRTRYVSDELCKKVKQAMEELNYHPNALARSLRSGESKTIGLIVPDNSNPFFAEVSRFIENIGFENGYSVILCNTDGILEKEAAYVSVLINKQVDGVIFIAAGNAPEHLQDLTNHHIPVVVVDRNLDTQAADIVLVNNHLGGELATRHLLELGHRRIACITGPSELTPSMARVHGYKNALTQAGIPLREDYIVPGDFRSRSGKQAIHQLLKLPEPPTAIFACNDLMAIGAIRALHESNRNVPRDISIVGFDNIPLASETMPALTTVAQPIQELAIRSAELLIARIQCSAPACETQRLILEPFLVVRDSTAPYLKDI